MKHLTIIFGKQGSGKSHVSKAIEAQHEEHLIARPEYLISQSHITNVVERPIFNGYTLIVVDDVQASSIGLIYAYLVKTQPQANYIITSCDHDFVCEMAVDGRVHVINMEER